MGACLQCLAPRNDRGYETPDVCWSAVARLLSYVRQPAGYGPHHASAVRGPVASRVAGAGSLLELDLLASAPFEDRERRPNDVFAELEDGDLIPALGVSVPDRQVVHPLPRKERHHPRFLTVLEVDD